MEERYKHFNQFLKNKFGERTLKICKECIKKKEKLALLFK